MDITVSSKNGRRQGATKEHTLHGSSTKKQRSRRPVFDETLRAEVFLALCFVAPRSQIPADMFPRRSAHKAKNPLSGDVQSFLMGCYL
jgi:hypothetical protein